MARQIADIHQQILDTIAADDVLKGLLTSTSKRAIYRLIAYTMAVSIGIEEQLMDEFVEQVEAIIRKGAPASNAWLQKKVLEFQHSETEPQIAKLVDYVVVYPVVREDYRIITRCSVTTDVASSVVIKVATDAGPLTSNQLAALQSYIELCGAGGIVYTCISQDADRLYVAGQVFYNGQYSDVISANVKQAINSFLAGLDFNGRVRVSDLAKVIKAVPGVSDALITDVFARSGTVPFSDATELVLDSRTISREWRTIAGHITAEDTPGKTLSDSLTFIPE